MEGVSKIPVSLLNFEKAWSILESILHNEYVTLCIWIYVVFMFILVCKCLGSSVNNTKIAKNLADAIMEGDTIKSIKIINSCPGVVNIMDRKSGYSPFLLACLYGNTQVVKYMLNRGADLSQTSSKKETAFYLAAYNRICNPKCFDATCLHTLYYFGADIDAPNESRFTPLQMAAMFGHTPLVRWLISKGANVMVSPDPYFLAKSQGHLKTAAALKTKGMQAIMPRN